MKATALAVLPYLAAAAIVAGVALGKLSPELACALAVALGLPSPVMHAVQALSKKDEPKP